MATTKNFDQLVKSGVIRNPEHFSDDEKQHLEQLTPDEINALSSIRSKLGDDFIQKKTGPSQSVAIVF